VTEHSGMSLIERWDASNSVRYCAHCEGEQGVGIGDPGDRACAACGQHDAPHVYVPLATYEGAVDAYLSELVAESRTICEREGVPNLAEWIGKTVLARVTGEGQ
jgi:hypothetical protein